MSVNLAAFITAIKPVLVERGVPFADRIPVVNAQFVVLQSDEPRHGPDGRPGARPAALRAAGASRSWRSLAGVALAPARRRALVIGASMVVGSLVLLLLGLQVLRALYLDDLEKVLLVPRGRRRCSSTP